MGFPSLVKRPNPAYRSFAVIYDPIKCLMGELVFYVNSLGGVFALVPMIVVRLALALQTSIDFTKSLSFDGAGPDLFPKA
jgi:hypothetical protein